MSMQSSFAGSRDPFTFVATDVELFNLELSIFGFVFCGRSCTDGRFGTRFIGAVFGS